MGTMTTSKCPDCGKDTSGSEGWSTNQCDDCYLDDQDRPTLATVTSVIRHDMSMAVLSAVTDDDEEILFACELRYAADIAEALHRGEEPRCAVEPWMRLG